MNNSNKHRLLPFLTATLLLISGCSETADKSDKQEKQSTTKTQSTTASTSATPQKTFPDKLTPDEDKPASDITPAMWKTETESGAVIYFMGSMHALPDEAYPFPDVIIDAYSSCDAIAVECDTVAFEKDYNAQFELAYSLVYDDGSKISDHIDEEIYNKLVEKTTEWGIYNSAFDYYRPAMWMSLIENYLMEASHLKVANAFDTFFLKQAKSDGKEIIEVEGMGAQMAMLTGFSYEIYNLILESYVTYTAEEYTESLNELYSLWKTGDIEGLAAVDDIDESLFTAEELAVYADYEKQMLTDRNKVMADKLIELTKGDKSVFFYVGAAHFGGEDGILKLLDDAGISYERVEY